MEVPRLRRRWRFICFFFFSSRRRHTRCSRDWSSDVCSSDLLTSTGTAAQLILESPETIVLAPGADALVVYGPQNDRDGDVPGIQAAVALAEIGRASCRERV